MGLGKDLLALYLGAGMFLGASLHFTSGGLVLMHAIMPKYLPWHDTAIYLTGVFEFLGGSSLVLTTADLRVLKLANSKWVIMFRSFTSYCCLQLVIAMTLANVNHWVNGIKVKGWRVPWWGHVLRMSYQVALIFMFRHLVMEGVEYKPQLRWAIDQSIQANVLLMTTISIIGHTFLDH